MLTLFSKFEFPDTFKLLVFNVDKFVKPNILTIILVVVVFKLLIDNVDYEDKLFILFVLLVSCILLQLNQVLYH